MSRNKELASAIVERYLEHYDDFFDALGNFVDDVNAYLKESGKTNSEKEILLVDDIFQEIEKINEAVGIDPKK